MSIFNSPLKLHLKIKIIAKNQVSSVGMYNCGFNNPIIIKIGGLNSPLKSHLKIKIIAKNQVSSVGMYNCGFNNPIIIKIGGCRVKK